MAAYLIIILPNHTQIISEILHNFYHKSSKILFKKHTFIRL